MITEEVHYCVKLEKQILNDFPRIKLKTWNDILNNFVTIRTFYSYDYDELITTYTYNIKQIYNFLEFNQGTM